MSRGAQGGSEADTIADAVLQAAAVLLDVTSEVLRETAPELGLSDLRVLVFLYREGPTRLVDVAEAMDVTSTTATRLGDRLGEQGFVERVRMGRDRREIHVAITDAGRSLVDEVFATRRRVVTTRLRGMSPAERSAGVTLLGRLTGGPEGRAKVASI